MFGTSVVSMMFHTFYLLSEICTYNFLLVLLLHHRRKPPSVIPERFTNGDSKPPTMNGNGVHVENPGFFRKKLRKTNIDLSQEILPTAANDSGPQQHDFRHLLKKTGRINLSES